DLVMIESDIDIPAPVSITGNTEQDRHVFFLAQYELQMCMGTRTCVIPHVAGQNWTTELTAYNNKNSTGTFTYSSWNADGLPDVVDQLVAVQPHGTAILLAGTNFAYDGTAVLTTTACLHFKLAYRYGESESLCDFFLHAGEGTIRWIMPNSIQEWFDWFGMAVCNPTDDDVVVAMDAYKDGQWLETFTKSLAPHTKTVGITSDFWTNLQTKKKADATYDDVDMVVLRSSYPLANPLSITGNSEQDRHVFFLAAGGLSDESEFPDPAFKAFVLANYDTDLSGGISQAEADAVTSMNTPGTYSSRGTIRDLTGIGKFRNLTNLECSCEQLSWLPDLSPLTSLNSLYAIYNYLVTVPELSALTSLNTLSLSANSISHVPNLTALTWMTNLYLDDNELTSVPNISGLASLSSLDVSGNHLSTLPDLSASAGTLRNLAFGSNNFTTFPDIASLSELHFLDCSYNQLTAMPDLSSHPDLVTLYCHENQFTTLPGLASLSSLRMLVCNKNQLTDLSAIAGLTELYSLSCRDNLLTSLPDMSALTLMRYLIISNNAISTIPGFSNLTALTTLHCNGTLISDLSAITGMPDMQYLKCNDCPIATLPDLSGLDNLQMLTCSNCLLTDIPDVTDCDSIWYLWCTGNYFGTDDCPTIQAIEAMGINFGYNPQFDGSTLTCP
ncbi:MAG: leucine-rich repeat domain-containing protein, partial [Holophagae bacterium]|nr:leucine-rich repeat domain-containing protein [Holophagae bacterium]